MKIFMIIFLLFTGLNIYSAEDEKLINMTLRLGEGGFSDSRSETGKLGGGETAFDFKLIKYPLAFSITGEFYTISPDAIHSYEIRGIDSYNLLYILDLEKYENISFFIGGGISIVEVPKDNNPDSSASTTGYNFQTGININVYKIFGIYGLAKYLYAYKKENEIELIDFDEVILLFGISLNFKL